LKDQRCTQEARKSDLFSRSGTYSATQDEVFPAGAQ
jgi:hypothetical protein